ncbi:DNA mismatch repair protein Pms1p [[Candida] jaroonii]|uniref:DNA mismatch repair protein Pms1p n=1 Tax=[Candida] jaroonii TaxID=467808 RepID=A0ACA9Y937_9ASCO|nr:DNA mismatch repair protein Pms1p [[Candida] jaroonii]
MKQLHANDIHRITSGQVIVDLQSIVKEVLENSLDAGASKVEILFKEHSFEGFEILDNGYGIKQQDFEGICRKHYTSKLSDFEGLNEIETLGFRGEALSSICSICDIKIITTTKEDLPYSYELQFNRVGELIDTQKKLNLLQEPGTKVVVSDIFKNLPVRLKNFKKNLKSEFNKMMMFLYNYVIIKPEVKYNINNIVNGTKKNLIITTGKSSMLDNFSSIFGYKSILGLKPVSVNTEDVEIQGYVSDNSSRTVKDRQFLFLNQRPIYNKPFMKVVNEVYQVYNTNFPVFILNLTIEGTNIDINVTPDKMTVNLNIDLEVIREKLNEVFESWNNLQTLRIEKPKPNYKPTVVKPQAPKKVIKPERISKKESIHNYVRMLNVPNVKSSLPRFPEVKSVVQDDMDIDTEMDEIIINKVNFQEMKIVGQFNLGFIITKFNGNLFIVDQHASDEKFNYEQLLNNYKIKSQRLITPISVDLNLIEKYKLDNETMEMNGFKLNDKNQLINLPIYKNNLFNTEDFIEFLNFGRISKKEKILASKACRKSIMIGQHLTRPTMKRVVQNLSNLDKPWNCPHGRPTVRFLNNKWSEFSKDYDL